MSTPSSKSNIYTLKGGVTAAWITFPGNSFSGVGSATFMWEAIGADGGRPECRTLPAGALSHILSLALVVVGDNSRLVEVRESL